ncbi:hypothetical protein A3H85_00310 [Candidatus Daviesbacteria bacterium RIFCSPLOWO2_02_FULL_40_8]|uniref:Ribonuclease J n=1 Tax=Candidatus Daviesbacteria bacterium RIFCSPLOWO2_01_FULL_40_24 TaxID=1797787 RepID=A0A1F5MJX7_9BACT|nr:MAG: hypothetical protein A2780_00665 [Candidatus Daviesbacteria bacterium RIFCSPHIGHO2_01_FULL_41_45]OGE34389.1 MAG: hypothetical protein A3C32_02030 [Candidatus Daviesbacteria bacterium RIFCSPHIGHO2_02_FULL_41_14]OGE65662.1 MAG: hypothetical protein A3B49_01665 [Candidatus Daviesbacteria bacterium RIFCSPLOWO2_01_FULL_40_24]OGE66070.1 MAG: hypothetical protein A3H85_00310 [Candidatus Daviesbacteria bacterium RIFCSPLOWO2_02_FULL_40_8]
MKSFKPSFSKPNILSPITQTLRVIPLGGVGDVTKNMYVYEYGNDIIVVDCGIGFPDEGMLGVDLVLPDITYLKERIHKVRGIVVTHGHDDHIGGLPYLWPQLQVPIYAQKLAAGFLKSKFSENKLPLDKIKTTDLTTQLTLGVFKVGFYPVAHSVPDSTGLIIDTPVGRVIHQSDFKMDWTPVNNQITDVKKITEAAKDGVVLMLIDGLRSERRGMNPSERPIENTFFEIGNRTQGKVIITTNSSSITRIQQAINVAVKLNRKVALIGRSMENNFQVASDLGYISSPPGLIIANEEIKRFADDNLMLIMAGSQGQPGSSLSRAANNDHRLVTFKKGDVVIVASDPIPLSMNTYYALIDKLSRSGIDVYYSDIQEHLHVSGHASSEEIKLMVSLVRPNYIMPIGTTFRGMRAFARLMKDLGYQDDKVITLDTQKVLLVTKAGVEIGEHIETQNVYVDGLGVGDVGTIVLRDRQVLAEEGIVVVILPIDYQTGRLAGEADIISRGFVFEKTSEELLADAKKVVDSALSDHKEGPLDWRFVRSHIEENLEKFFYEETKRRPMILPVVVEV